MTDHARNNTIENFKLVFDRNFLKTVISRMDENGALSRRELDDPEFQGGRKLLAILMDDRVRQRDW